MENESTWVVNGIITIALVVLVAPFAAKVIDELAAFVLWMVVMYVMYTTFSGEAIDPPRPK